MNVRSGAARLAFPDAWRPSARLACANICAAIAGRNGRVRSALHPWRGFVSHQLSQRRHERNPVGLLVVIGLHVLLALMMLTARLHIETASTSQPALAKIDPPPSEPMQWHDLPSAPAAPMRRIVVPVPEVIVDRPDPIQATTQDVPPVPRPAPTVAAGVSVSKSDSAGASVGSGDGAGGGARVGRIAPRLARVDASAPQCQPEYPVAARLHHVGGTTRLRFTVDSTGRIVGVKLLGHSGEMAENFQMDRAAMDSLVQCPATVGIDESGHAVGGTADINYIWNML
jgi:periplasmic protein TonB